MSNLIVSAVLLLAAVGLAGAARAQHVIAKDESAPEYQQKNLLESDSPLAMWIGSNEPFGAVIGGVC